MGIFTTILATIAVVAQLFDAEKMVITLLGSSDFCSINNDKILNCQIITSNATILFIEIFSEGLLFDLRRSFGNHQDIHTLESVNMLKLLQIFFVLHLFMSML